MQVREQLAVDELDQVLPGLARRCGRACRPHSSARPRSASGMPRRGSACNRGLPARPRPAAPSPVVEIFEEQQPGGLLGVIQFRSQALVIAHDPVDVVECVFEHALQIFLVALEVRRQAAQQDFQSVARNSVRSKWESRSERTLQRPPRVPAHLCTVSSSGSWPRRRAALLEAPCAAVSRGRQARRGVDRRSTPFRQHTDVLSKSPATAHGLVGRSPASAKWGGLLFTPASCPSPFGPASPFAPLLRAWSLSLAPDILPCALRASYAVRTVPDVAWPRKESDSRSAGARNAFDLVRRA